MTDRRLDLEPKTTAAIAELKALVRPRFPEAALSISRSDEDPSIVHLTTVVDIDDPDDVTDLVIDRMRVLLVDEGLPIYIIPIRSPERVASVLEAATSSPATP